jgi:selenocysteine lyase/cysteine desulfurase
MSINNAEIQADLCSDSALIHFNSAGSSLMPKPVLDCQIEHLELEARIGGYEAANLKAKDIDAVYSSVAALINCAPNEVALVENATIAWTLAFYSIDFQAGDKILTAESEYGSNYLAYLKMQRERGIIVEVIPSNEQGEVCVKSLCSMLDGTVKLISITHIPTNNGLVNPIQAIGEIARNNNILYLVDACQTAGQLPIDVKKIHCDFLTATGRKYLRGPRGTGFLYVRQSTLVQVTPPIIDVRSAQWTSLESYQFRDDAKRFENWENNYSALLAMGCAIDYALKVGIDNIAATNRQLAIDLRQKLAALEGVTVQDIGREKCAIVTFSIEGLASATVKVLLQEYRINVSCSNPSSTLIDATKRKLPPLIRASIHYFNRLQDNDKLISALSDILQDNRVLTGKNNEY